MTQETADKVLTIAEEGTTGLTGMVGAGTKGIYAYSIATALLQDNVKLETRIKELEDKIQKL